MRRLWAVLCALLSAPGCATEGGKGFFDDALKDLRGDNQQMRTNTWATQDLWERPAVTKGHD